MSLESQRHLMFLQLEKYRKDKGSANNSSLFFIMNKTNTFKPIVFNGVEMSIEDFKKSLNSTPPEKLYKKAINRLKK